MLRAQRVAAGVALVALTGCAATGWTDEMIGAWNAGMQSLRVALCIGAALAIVPAALLIPRRGVGNVVSGILACCFAVVVFFSYFDFFNPNVRYAKYYHRHEFFHTFLPAKYSSELGYDRLYVCSVVAQSELL